MNGGWRARRAAIPDLGKKLSFPVNELGRVFVRRDVRSKNGTEESAQGKKKELTG